MVEYLIIIKNWFSERKCPVFWVGHFSSIEQAVKLINTGQTSPQKAITVATNPFPTA